MATLDDMAIGDRARIIGFREQTPYSAQLARMGLIPGTEFELKRRAPLGDPVEIHVRGFTLGLRSSEASVLDIERL